MIYCIHCGTELPDTAKFCRSCGGPQHPSTTTPPPQESAATRHKPSPTHNTRASDPLHDPAVKAQIADLIVEALGAPINEALDTLAERALSGPVTTQTVDDARSLYFQMQETHARISGGESKGEARLQMYKTASDALQILRVKWVQARKGREIESDFNVFILRGLRGILTELVGYSKQLASDIERYDALWRWLDCQVLEELAYSHIKRVGKFHRESLLLVFDPPGVNKRGELDCDWAESRHQAFQRGIERAKGR